MGSGSQIARQHLVEREAEPPSVVNRLNLDVEYLCPFRNRMRLVVVGQKYRRLFLSTVVGLLLHSCPATIAGFIVPVVVWETIQFEIHRRPFAHVSQEVLEGIQPAITNRNAATTVARVRSTIGVATPLLHSSPTAVGNRVRHSMSAASLYGHIVREASATTDAASQCGISQASRRANDFVSAVALAVPQNQICSTATSKRKDDKSLESFPAKIENAVVEFRQVSWLGRINDSHETFLSLEGHLGLEPAGVQPSDRLASFYPLSFTGGIG